MFNLFSFFGSKKQPDDLSFQPLIKDVKRYSFEKARSDFISAISVAFLTLPQALAYSIVVGLPPSAVLFSVIFGTAIGALFASSSHLVIGPNNATVLLVQASLAAILAKFYPMVIGQARIDVALDLLAALTLLIGLFQLLASFFKLGRLIQFVSHSVIVGYVAGSALAIAVGQLFPLIGIPCPDDLDSLYHKMSYWFRHLGSAHAMTVGVGLTSMFLLAFLRRVFPHFPASLFMVVIITASVALFSLDTMQDAQGRTLSLLESGEKVSFLPSFETPLFHLSFLNTLLPMAFAISLIGMLEANSLAKSIAATSGQRIIPTQEIFALGSSNFFLSFLGAVPCSGSISRTTLNYDSGARTRFSAILSAGFVALLLLCFGSLFRFVPQASLAALLVATAFKMVDKKQLKLCLRATTSDAFVLLFTFFSCIFLSLQLAFYIGVALSIILYLKKSAVPKVVENLYHEETGELRPILGEERRPRPIRIIDVEGELFFGAVDIFQYTLRAIAEDDSTSKVIILRLKHVHDFDATAALGLKQLKDYLTKSGRYLVISSVPPHVLEVLRNTRLLDYLLEENIIPLDEKSPHSAHGKAIQRAKDILLQERTYSL
jgi:sulfate permease, SulP family